MYVVNGYDDDRFSRTLGIFTTHELAEDFIKKYQEFEITGDYHIVTLEPDSLVNCVTKIEYVVTFRLSNDRFIDYNGRKVFVPVDSVPEPLYVECEGNLVHDFFKVVSYQSKEHAMSVAMTYRRVFLEMLGGSENIEVTPNGLDRCKILDPAKCAWLPAFVISGDMESYFAK